MNTKNGNSIPENKLGVNFVFDVIRGDNPYLLVKALNEAAKCFFHVVHIESIMVPATIPNISVSPLKTPAPQYAALKFIYCFALESHYKRHFKKEYDERVAIEISDPELSLAINIPQPNRN